MFPKDIIYIFEATLGRRVEYVFESLHNHFEDMAHAQGMANIDDVVINDDGLNELVEELKDFSDDKCVALKRTLQFIKMLEEKGVVQSPLERDENLNKLYQLNASSLMAATKVLLRLDKLGKLDEDAYHNALQSVSASLKKPNVFYGRSKRFQKNGENYRFFFMNEPSPKDASVYPSFYINQQASVIGSGAYGQVQIAHTALDKSDKPLAVKWFKGEYDECLRLACHEHKYHQLSYPQRKSFVFNYGFEYVALCYDWLPGSSLGKTRLDYRIIKSSNLELRLKLVQTLLAGLNVLHSHFRVHGDIAFENIIYNPFAASLMLTDFNLSARPYANRPYLFRERTADPYLLDHRVDKSETQKYSFADDLYTVAIILASFFPEVFDSLGVYGFYSKISPPENGYTVEQIAIKALILAIWHEDIPTKIKSYVHAWRPQP